MIYDHAYIPIYLFWYEIFPAELIYTDITDKKLVPFKSRKNNPILKQPGNMYTKITISIRILTFGYTCPHIFEINFVNQCNQAN